VCEPLGSIPPPRLAVGRPRKGPPKALYIPVRMPYVRRGFSAAAAAPPTRVAVVVRTVVGYRLQCTLVSGHLDLDDNGSDPLTVQLDEDEKRGPSTWRTCRVRVLAPLTRNPLDCGVGPGWSVVPNCPHGFPCPVSFLPLDSTERIECAIVKPL